MDEIIYYIIDDDDQVLATLSKLIDKVFPGSVVKTESNGLDAWDEIRRETRPMIVISDLTMPGMNGLNLLKRVKTTGMPAPLYFILLTASADKDTNIKAMQQGADDFLGKPFSVDQLIGKLRAAHRIVNLQLLQKAEKDKSEQLTEALEDQKKRIFDLVRTVQIIKFPEAEKNLPKFEEAALYVAVELGEADPDELEAIKKAASLAYIGKLNLGEAILKGSLLIDGLPKNETVEKIPEFIKSFLSHLTDIDKVVDILVHIYENFDGSGYPDKQKAWQIPLGSRIMRIINDFEEAVTIKKVSPSKAIEALELESRRWYDFRLVTLFDQYLGSKEVAKEKPIKAKEISEGMMITRNIVTNSGMKIVGAGNSMNAEKIEKLFSIIKSDPVIGRVFIKA